MRLRTSSFLAPLLVVALLAGCSSDDGGKDGNASGDKDKRTTTTAERSGGGGADDPDAPASPDGGTAAPVVTAPGTPSTIENPDPQPEPNRSRYCGVWGRLVTTNTAAYDDDDPVQLKNHYTAVLGVARELEAVAPLDIKGAVQVAMREAQTVVDTGSRDQFQSDESRVNGRRLQEYAEQHC